jgi:hypothetical protein
VAIDGKTWLDRDRVARSLYPQSLDDARAVQRLKVTPVFLEVVLLLFDEIVNRKEPS